MFYHLTYNKIIKEYLLQAWNKDEYDRNYLFY